MKIKFDELKVLSVDQQKPLSGSQTILDVDFKSISISLNYCKTIEGFKVFKTEAEMWAQGVPAQDCGRLEVKLDIEGMFGGPLVSFYNPENSLTQLKRHSAVSLAIHLPEGGVSARDGIGDWTKVITLSTNKPSDCD